MKKAYKLIVPIILLAVLVGVAALFLHRHTVAVFNPRGTIADQQRRLIIIAVALSMIVVIPVFIMAAVISWRYRANKPHKNAAYQPDWANSHIAETIWWGVPTLIIGVLSVITWQSSHQLDPYRPLSSTVKPITIQVVALQWRWLFIYPDQHVASVNLVEFPAHTPVQFDITSDAPMNSFWIPQLAGQIYAMSGMTTQLHLMADKTGDFYGSSANLSGAGFAGMNFTARASTQSDFNMWVKNAQKSSQHLTQQAYTALAKPSQDHKVMYYTAPDQGLYDTIVMKYMMPPMTPDSTDKSQPTAAKNTNDSSTKTSNTDDSMQGMDMSGMGM